MIVREPAHPHDGGVSPTRLISWIAAQWPQRAQPRFPVWSERRRTAHGPKWPRANGSGGGVGAGGARATAKDFGAQPFAGRGCFFCAVWLEGPPRQAVETRTFRPPVFAAPGVFVAITCPNERAGAHWRPGILYTPLPGRGFGGRPEPRAARRRVVFPSAECAALRPEVLPSQRLANSPRADW